VKAGARVEPFERRGDMRITAKAAFDVQRTALDDAHVAGQKEVPNRQRRGDGCRSADGVLISSSRVVIEA